MQISEQKTLKNLKKILQIKKQSFQAMMMSVLSALAISFSFLWLIQWSNGSMFMASVSNASNNQSINVHFDADIVLENTDTTFNLIFGTDAENVDSVEGVVVFDASEGFDISSEFLQKLDTGMYRFVIPNDGKMLKKWTIIARFKKNNIKTPNISLVDTQFVSKNIRYNLSNIVQ